MADLFNIYEKCRVCNGDGKYERVDPETHQIISVECYECKGVGEVYWGQMREEEPPLN